MLLAFVDSPQRHRRLTIFPVVASDEPQLSYLLMTDALRRGVLTLGEREPGNPPHFVAQNRSPHPVLILDCETVEGGGVNHATTQSVLLGPGSVTKVPMSCRDAGKWSCEKLREKFSESLASFSLLEDQVGILAFLDRQLLGLDILGSPELFEAVHQRLLAGHLMTASSAGTNGGFDPLAEEADLQALALALQEAIRMDAPCPGRGEYSTLHGEVSGGELRHNGHLVHLSVFPAGTAA
jgi:hypothetical protein